jgi:hypothetical protein
MKPQAYFQLFLGVLETLFEALFSWQQSLERQRP